MAGTSGAIQDNARLTYNGTTLDNDGPITAEEITATTSVTANTIVSSRLTSGRVVFSDGSGLVDSSSMTFDNGTGEITVSGAKVSNLTDNRIVIAGTSGKLEDSSELTFDGNEFAVSGANTNLGANTLFIEDGGGVGIHETNPEARLHVSGDVVVSGDITASYTSDERLKENVTPLDNPIGKLNQIRGVDFDWIAGIDREFSDYISPKEGHDIGVIAQDVEKVLPEAVQYYPDGYMGVNYPKLVPVLLEAIKHLNNRVEQLESQVNKNGNES